MEQFAYIELKDTLATCASALGEAMRMYRTDRGHLPPEHWVRAHDAALDRLTAAGWGATAQGLAKEMLSTNH